MSDLTRVETPLNIRKFREFLLYILMGYFKNNVILINNLVELSEHIIMKIDDLIYLISLLSEVEKSEIQINADEILLKRCCGMVINKVTSKISCY
jgi:hypothetical protein